MKSHSIVVSEADMDRLGRLLRSLQHSLFRDHQQLELLEEVLEGADVRPSRRVPKNVIRVHSRARVRDFDTQQEESFVVVFPDQADVTRGFISVLAPVGMALLGRRKGDVIQAKVPGGTRRLKVEQVSQRDSEATNSSTHRSHRPTDSGLENGLAA